MTKRIRRLVAGVGIAAAVATATTLTTDQTAPRVPGDTTWGAPATTNDTTWGEPATTNDEDGEDGEGEDTPATPQGDTTWG